MARHVFGINRNWLYSDTVLPGSMHPEFDDSGWERVTVPHTNRLLPWHSFDDRDYQFISVYRRHFRLPRDLQGQRVFADFAGVMTAATVVINGVRLGDYRGGYTPFSFELTPHLDWHGDNVLAVEVDSRERADIPPFGGQIDYLTFGGMYREVALRVVAPTYIQNVFAKPINVLDDDRRVDVRCFLDNTDNTAGAFRLVAELRDGDRVLQAAETEVNVATGSLEHVLTLSDLHDIDLWDIDRPRLYQVHVRLEQAGQEVDADSVRIGFRDARFTPDGFFLNGHHLKLRGLNRHQTFPFVGQAMPARVQRRDALILKHELKLNLVRTSHYPQSPAFLDCCDEIGLLVFEEIPGWQHIGDRM